MTGYHSLPDSGNYWYMNMFTVEVVSADKSDTNFNYYGFVGNDFSNILIMSSYDLGCLSSNPNRVRFA